MDATADSGVAGGAVVIEFADAVLDTDGARLEAARAALLLFVGAAGLVDSAAIVSTFNAIVRIADATGMPLSDAVLEETAEFREALGVNDFRTSTG